MSLASIRQQAEEKYPPSGWAESPDGDDYAVDDEYGYDECQRAAYVQGRLDQAEADALIAEDYPGPLHSYQDIAVANDVAAAIREAVAE